MLKIRILHHLPSVLPASLAVVVLMLTSLTVSTNSHADVLAIPDENASQTTVPLNDSDLPRRGITKSQVESEYGAPKLKHPAIGDPPITRWDYEGFSVFFEYNHVLHSVIPDKPKPIYNKGELNTGY